MSEHNGNENRFFPLSEFALGNAVCLKSPYVENDCHYQWGIVVRHVGIGAKGVPRVGLHVYDNTGRPLMESGRVPAVVKFLASQLIVGKEPGNAGHSRENAIPTFPLGSRDHPMCPGCQGEEQPPSAGRCPQCRGRGYLIGMRMAG
ncbi:MAG: hypothetical protein H7210_00315 [Pyrinomonadaceae bacterium]|nr:hypothetical protein [Phycisphaerales bacterium]